MDHDSGPIYRRPRPETPPDPSTTRDRYHEPEYPSYNEPKPFNPFEGTGFESVYQEFNKDGDCIDYQETRESYTPKTQEED